MFTFLYAATIFKGLNSATRAAFSGVAYTVGILVASSAAIGLLNPAVALGIRAWATAYFVGPFIGAILGINLYTMVFAEPKVVKAAEVSATITRKSVTKKAVTKKKTSKKK